MSKYVLLSLASLLVLSSCVENKEISTTNNDSSGYVQVLEKTSSKIKETKEFESCLNPSITMCIAQTANQLAREQKSVAFCDELNDASNRDACKFGVVSIQATDMKTINLCDTLSDTYRRECRVSILQSEAFVSSDIEKCNLILGEYPLGGHDAGGSDRVDQCRMNFLIKKDLLNTKECNLIKNSSMKGMCISMIKSENIPKPETLIKTENTPKSKIVKH